MIKWARPSYNAEKSQKWFRNISWWLRMVVGVVSCDITAGVYSWLAHNGTKLRSQVCGKWCETCMSLFRAPKNKALKEFVLMRNDFTQCFLFLKHGIRHPPELTSLQLTPICLALEPYLYCTLGEPAGAQLSTVNHTHVYHSMLPYTHTATRCHRRASGFYMKV